MQEKSPPPSLWITPSIGNLGVQMGVHFRKKNSKAFICKRYSYVFDSLLRNRIGFFSFSTPRSHPSDTPDENPENTEGDKKLTVPFCPLR